MKKQHLCIPLLTIILFGCTSAPEQPDANAGLPPCGMLPNCVNSDSGIGGSAIAPLPATVDQWQALKRWLAQQDDWTITAETADFVQAVVKTPLMQFRDDVQLAFNEQASDIEVRSSSRLGISDMGANRRRIEGLRAHLLSEAAVAVD
jgi:uncharacterized protein (DUF1499 family)